MRWLIPKVGAGNRAAESSLRQRQSDVHRDNRSPNEPISDRTVVYKLLIVETFADNIPRGVHLFLTLNYAIKYGSCLELNSGTSKPNPSWAVKHFTNYGIYHSLRLATFCFFIISAGPTEAGPEKNG